MKKLKSKIYNKLSGIKMKKKKTGLTTGYCIITILVIFAFTQCDVFKNDSGEIPTSDMGITAVDAPSSVIQGESAEISVTLKNFGNREVTDSIRVTLTDDTDRNTLTTQFVSSLSPDSSRSFTYSWNTEEASIGEHTLTAFHDYEDNEKSNDTTSVSLTIGEPAEADIAVSDINAPSSARLGDDVNVEVTLQNRGGEAVNEEISITLEDQTDDFTVGTQTVNELGAGGTTTLTFNWNTGEASSGEHQLRASHDIEDENSDNNAATATITLSEQQENDIAITQINAPTSATRGNEVDIDVTVENTGNQPVDEDINVTLENQTDNTTIEIQTIDGLEEGGSTTLTYSWNTGEASIGEHQIQATHSFNDDNNNNNSDAVEITISEQQERDIAITNVNSASSVEQGEEIDIEVTVENTGNQLISENINVTLEDQTDGVTIGTQTVSDLEAGDNTTLTYSWDTGNASTGEHEIEASHSFDDDNPGNNSGSTSVTVNEPTVIDIGITDVSAVSSATQGENVTVSVTVQNQGNSDVTEDIAINLTNETMGETIGGQTIGSLSTGSSEVRTFIWETGNAQTGTHTIVASHDLDDDNNSNDSESTNVTIEEPADLSISGVSASPSSVIEGETVNIEVTIENTGDQTAGDFNVTLDDLTDGNTIGTQTVSSLDPGNSTTLSFNWDTEGASAGSHNLQASNSFNDDTGSETVTVNEAVTDIATTELNAPSSTVQGNTVNVEVTVENTGNQPVNGDIGVLLQDLTDGDPVNTQEINGLDVGAAETLTFSWNTQNASIGEHELQAVHSIDDDNSSNDTESVFVTVEEPADIAVTEVDAPSSASQGETVDVNVTIENTSNQAVEENFDVILDDVTDGITINTQTVSGLEAGATTTLSYSWNTGDASTGEHELRASHMYSDANSDNDEASAFTTVNEPLEITDITPNSMEKDTSAEVTITGSGFEAGIEVTFENGSGQSPTASNITVNDSETISATVTTSDNGGDDNRIWDVRVTNPDDSTAILENGFTVTADDDD